MYPFETSTRESSFQCGQQVKCPVPRTEGGYGCTGRSNVQQFVEKLDSKALWSLPPGGEPKGADRTFALYGSPGSGPNAGGGMRRFDAAW